MCWNKPPQTKGYWLGGFSAVGTLNGARYTPPASGFPAFPTLSTGELTLTNAPTGTEITIVGNLNFKSLFTFPVTLDKVKLTVNKTTGVMTGSFLDRFTLVEGVPQPLLKPITRKLQGVMIQAEDRAAGFFQSTNSVGTWELTKE